MKKLYTLVLFLNLAFIASAQVPVTLEVDMNNVPEIGMGGVHVAGNFGDLTPGQPTWVQDGLQMMDGDDDGIYSITLDLLPGEYQFKYLNGNVWAAEEDVPGICEYMYRPARRDHGGQFIDHRRVSGTPQQLTRTKVSTFVILMLPSISTSFKVLGFKAPLRATLVQSFWECTIYGVPMHKHLSLGHENILKTCTSGGMKRR